MIVTMKMVLGFIYLDEESIGDCIIKDIVEGEGLKFIAGYAAHRFRIKYCYLGTITKKLPPTSTQCIDWIRCLSDGHLMYPSDDLYMVTIIMNETFEQFHGSTYSKESGIFKTVTDLTQAKIMQQCPNVKVPREVITLLVRTRTYIRVRAFNKKLKTDIYNKHDKKKVLKFVR